MSEALNEIKINVAVCGRRYPLTIEPSREEFVRKAAKVVDQKIASYAGNFSAKDNQDLLAMVALDVVTTLLANQSYAPEKLIDKVVSGLDKLGKELNALQHLQHT